MSDLSRYVAELTPGQLAVLCRRIRERAQQSPASQSSPIRAHRADADLHPLSFAQQRLWFLDRLVPENPFYNIPAALRLSGALDEGALRRALEEIVRRHEALRTTFTVVLGQPAQVIGAPAPVEMPVVDLSGAGEGERAEGVRRLVQAEARRPFDLARGPLLRAMLLLLGGREHVLVMVMHHIVSDNWSVGVVTRELAALYGAFSEGRESPLAELPVQYADFARWQREWMQGEVLSSQLSYWKRHLEGVSDLRLPTDRPRPAVHSYRGALRPYRLDARLSSALREMSRREGVTLFMLLLAAFDALLYRYTGQEDIVVGTPIANRTRAEVEPLIGFFANMLVMRSRPTGATTFRQLLHLVRRDTLDAYTHQDLPFEKLVGELRPERDLSRTPIFQAVFALSNAPMPPLELPGLTLENVEVEIAAAMFDLILGIIDTEPELTGFMLYNPDLFDGETVGRMLAHYTAVLEEVVARPDCCLIDIPLGGAAEPEPWAAPRAHDEAEQFNL